VDKKNFFRGPLLFGAVNTRYLKLLKKFFLGSIAFSELGEYNDFNNKNLPV
jgi:hypothetical protein